MTLIPPASARVPVDPSLLGALQQSLRVDSAEWASHGGTAATRCTLQLNGLGAASFRTGVRYTGHGGAALITTGGSSGPATGPGPGVGLTSLATGGVAQAIRSVRGPVQAPPAAVTQSLAAAGASGSSLYLTRRAAVLPISPRVHRALNRHGLTTSARWFRLSAAGTPAVTAMHGALTSLPAMAGFGVLLGDGAVTTLSLSTSGQVSTYRGQAQLGDQRGTDIADFEAKFTSGHLSRFTLSVEEDGAGMVCTATTTFDRPTVKVPATPTRHNKIVAEEVQLASLVQEVATTPLMGSHHARVRLLQGYALALTSLTRRSGHAVVVSELAHGVALTRNVKGWKHPLRWQLTLDKQRLVTYSVRTTGARWR